MKLVMAATAALALAAGCASTPTAVEIANADYGPPPANAEAAVRQFMQTHLRDPTSAQYRYVAGPGALYGRMLGRRVVGWGVCYRVNARNGFGGYTGERLHLLVFNRGRVVEHIYADGESFDIMGAMAENACRTVATSARAAVAPVAPPTAAADDGSKATD